ncbi:hypothetical protein ASD39_25235 [Sphingomonas sp. Root50]|jgi:hypothetical protein|nr:hypothetical protein L286_16815 [Sphingobium sp. HDIP04]KQX24177.1 hypothetical protein ASD17_24800 [Sphingomonas sp. Root1294]KQY69649.1 hypothetical protein ASD39_25235 [Sphingomonas sp. Root50]KRB92981.1 hypothetical protein ASE22_25780 [Sphingomonas sp. Root720]TXI25448.1 MAG: hypothetical protein E6Q67_00985 [Roseateles sp.]
MTAMRSRSRWLVWTLVAAGLLLFVLANAHFLYVAFRSQPECVGHLKERASGDGQYRAAKSAC